MRISELARTTGVPVATIKFYLREGLVPEGIRTSPNQAQYDDAHVQRLRLVRALVGVGGLSLAATKEVLGHIDEPAQPTLDLLGTAHRAVAPELPDEVDVTPAVVLLRRWGWSSCLDPVEGKRGDRVDEGVAGLAVALAGLDDAGFEVEPDRMDTYAEAMMQVAQAEIDGLPTETPAAAVRYVVLGTVLVEPVLLALRRLAQREASVTRFPPPRDGAPPVPAAATAATRPAAAQR
jgi:DNA-binding transcriptional MerR regulator